MMTDAALAPSRPAVSVVVPFYGGRGAAERLAEALARLRLRPGDELIVADNTPRSSMAAVGGADAAPRIVAATGERSSYHARNVGAECAGNAWLLFVDADCVPDADLLDAYFRQPVEPDVGALAGRIAPLADRTGLLESWAASRGILSQERLLAEEGGAATANLLVRTAAWQAVGGFQEGIRSGGDLEFCWRLRDAGYRIESRPDARVSHVHRDRLGSALRAMARYAAGNAWHERRRPGSASSPLGLPGKLANAVAGSAWFALTLRWRRAAMKVVDGLAALAQAWGRLLDNRARPMPADDRERDARALLVVATDRFPVASETFVVNEVAALGALGWRVEVEAVQRPERPLRGASRGVVRYLEDEGVLTRVGSLALVAARHPWRCAEDVLRRRRWSTEERMPLRAIAPQALRLMRGSGRHVHVHFASLAAINALRAGRIAGVTVSISAHAHEIFRRPVSLPAKLRAAQLVVADCDYTVRHLRPLLDADRDGRVHRIVMGVDGERFRRQKPYPGGRTVVAVGRYVEKKGFEYLIRAAALLEDADALDRVVIAGDGPLRPTLERLVATLGLEDRVQLANLWGHQAVRELLEEAALLTMPCVVAADGDRDSMPVVVKEALAMEVPVVASDEVGLPEMVRSEWGRLVPPKDPEALAGAIAELLALPPERRAEMGAAGRHFALEHCSLERETAKLAGLIREVSGVPASQPV